MKQRVVSASEFKNKYAEYLDEIEQSGSSLTITKKGRPVAVIAPIAVVRPIKKKAWKSLANSWAGRAKIVGDIVNPDPNLWECAKER